MHFPLMNWMLKPIWFNLKEPRQTILKNNVKTENIKNKFRSLAQFAILFPFLREEKNFDTAYVENGI